MTEILWRAFGIACLLIILYSLFAHAKIARKYQDTPKTYANEEDVNL